MAAHAPSCIAAVAATSRSREMRTQRRWHRRQTAPRDARRDKVEQQPLLPVPGLRVTVALMPFLPLPPALQGLLVSTPLGSTHARVALGCPRPTRARPAISVAATVAPSKPPWGYPRRSEGYPTSVSGSRRATTAPTRLAPRPAATADHSADSAPRPRGHHAPDAPARPPRRAPHTETTLAPYLPLPPSLSG
jgi:hypothetical protein